MDKDGVKIRIVRSRRKTIAIQITKDGQVIVRAPLRVPESELCAIVAEKEEWIRENLLKVIEENKGMAQEKPFSMEEIDKLADKAMVVLPKLTAYYAERIGVSYGRITIRNQKTRWGSCSSKGNLNFNCFLMLAPKEVQAYVVVHELCHRIEMNHSKAFWTEVERVMPNYKEQEKWLKECGSRLLQQGR